MLKLLTPLRRSIWLDFCRTESIADAINAGDDLDVMFDRLLEQLETVPDLAARVDRAELLVEIARRCSTAAQLTVETLAGR